MAPVRKYALIQLPELILAAVVLIACHHYGWLSATMAWVLFALWVGKELALYPLYRRALGVGPPVGAAALYGQPGHAVTALAPSGHIRVGGELWRARTQDGDHLASGSAVSVVGHEGLTLIVCHDGVSERRAVIGGDADTAG